VRRSYSHYFDFAIANLGYDEHEADEYARVRMAQDDFQELANQLTLDDARPVIEPRTQEDPDDPFGGM
jgi:hypothetical protein